MDVAGGICLSWKVGDWADSSHAETECATSGWTSAEGINNRYHGHAFRVGWQVPCFSAVVIGTEFKALVIATE